MYFPLWFWILCERISTRDGKREGCLKVFLGYKWLPEYYFIHNQLPSVRGFVLSYLILILSHISDLWW